ncbi:TnsA endonuclease N-terminal domain-containing protein [Peribacillus sp. SCS-37]|uniref:TnsA endonuclease N-terminal domain-containing protein n=1 Tax=Paraperibacillus esterisolvens TaxID=3115296 RepID=UPI003905C4DC
MLSDELGIKHPANLKTSERAEMTTDFLVTINISGEIQHFTRTLKFKNELVDKRVLEKFEIARFYWKRHDIWNQ